MNTLFKETLGTMGIASLLAPVAFATEFKADTTGDWDVGTSWVGDAKPGTGALARIAGSGRSNTIVTLDTNETVSRFILGQGGTGGALTITSGGTLNTSSGTDHRFGQISAFEINLETGGSVNVPNATITSDAGSTFNIYGGNFDASGYNAGSGSAATINVRSSAATIDVANTSIFGSNSTVMFDFDAGTSISSWNTDDFTIGSGAKLEVLGLSLVGAGNYELVNFTGTLSGAYADPSDITITGLGAGLAGSITYDADSMNLNVVAVPEPSSGVLLGLGGLALVFRRRK